MSVAEEIKESFARGSVLTRLIYINLGVFVTIRLLNVFFFLAGAEFPFLEWLAMPADFSRLAWRPWTLITYMFLHFDFLHILFNILWLYWLGKIFLSYFDQRKLLGLYLIGGIAGGLFYLIGYNVFPVFSSIRSASLLMGASASVIAVVAALAVHAPNHALHLLFIGAVKMKYIALATILLYIIGIASANAGGNLAHLGGAFGGMMFVLQLRRGVDLTNVPNQVVEALMGLIKTKRKIKVSYRKPPDDIEYNRQKNKRQEEINKILDKISKSGYDSLSREEKEILFKHGN